MKLAYYNEIDPYAAHWLRNLIASGHIAAGDVDERSIVEVTPDDLRGYRQCHFFAGIGGWSYALRLAGCPDDRSFWTGSCPCQPFSAACKKRGSDDERHLWPAFFRLIRECRPAVVAGEQVAGAAGYAWWDHVAADLEGEGYAAAAADIGAHSVGSPHRRQRLYWVAHADQQQWGPRRPSSGTPSSSRSRFEPAGRGDADRMADSDGAGQRERAERDGSAERSESIEASRRPDADGCAELLSLGDANVTGLEGRRDESRERAGQCAARTPGPWSDLEWLQCSDGTRRPTQPGIFPLVDGLPEGLVRGGDRSMAPDADSSAEARVMRLRAYGNAIVPQLAARFIAAIDDLLDR